MRKSKSLLWMFGFFSLAVMFRAGYLQILGDERLENRAKKQLYSKVLVTPRRGAILDRNGVSLVTNRETQSLAANPLQVANKKKLANQLSRILKIPVNRLLKRLEGESEFIWVKRHLTPEELHHLDRLGYFHPLKKEYEGFWLVKENQRSYPNGQLALPLIGRVNVDSEGLEGIELERNDSLRGKTIKISTEKDGLGRPAFLSSEVSAATTEGNDLNLSIDLRLQYSLETELKLAVEKNNADSAMGVILSAETGEVLALGQFPFDVDHLRNRVVSDGFEPGSILKPVLYASALSHGMKSTDEVYGEKGQFLVQGRWVKEAEAHERFEWISLEQVIQLSSNVGAAKLGMKLGQDDYQRTLLEFGFGEKLGLSFPGEFTGKIPGGKWSPLTLANMSFGQGLTVSGVQMAAAYAPFLNGGYWVKPKLTLDHDPVEKRRVISTVTANAVKQALLKVTEPPGTGVRAKLEGYSVAGKTGTAQVVDPITRKYSTSHYRASYVGFATDLEQKLVILVSVDRPRGVIYGSEVAAPLFREVLQSVVMRYGDAPRKMQELKISQSAPVQVASEKTLGVMSNLSGLTLREALLTLQNEDIQVEIHGEGLIKSFTPAAGKTLAPREVVRIDLSE